MKGPLSWSMRFALALLSVFAIGTLSAGGLSWLLLSRELTQKLADDARAAAESFVEIAASGDRTDLMEQIAAQVRASRDGTSLFAFIDGATGETIGSLHPGQPFEGPRRLVVERDIPPVVAADPVEAYLAYGIRTDLGWVIAAQDEAWVVESGEILMQATIGSLAAAAAVAVAGPRHRPAQRAAHRHHGAGTGRRGRRSAGQAHR